MEKIALRVSPFALERIKTLRQVEEGQILRLAVMGGGCSGLKYELSFITEVKDHDQLFTFQLEDEKIDVVVDAVSAPYLDGSTLDYDDSLNGKGFEIINPNADRTCGCGMSFGV